MTAHGRDPVVSGESSSLLVAPSLWRGRPAFAAAAVLLLLASGCSTIGSPPVPGSEKVLDPQSGYIIDAQARGRPLRLKVDPGAPYFVLLNGKVAKELRLVSTKAATLAVGPMRLKGKTRTEKFTIGGVTAAKPVMWFTGEALAHPDGIINPANLPSELITLQLRETRPGEQIIELPMRFDRQRGLYYEFDYGGQLILTRLTLDDPLTTTTGAAASVIAKRRSGLWDGGPFTHDVRFGIARPVRRMVLGEPLSVPGFPLDTLAVRIHDDRGSYLLPEKALPTTVDDEDIIVTGKYKRRYGAPHFWLMIGSNDLSRCSRISYNRKSKRLMLSCSTTQPYERKGST